MYLFLLGRDKDLSKLEIAIYLQKNKIAYSIIANSDKFLILDLDKKETELVNLTKELGGLVRVCKIYLSSQKITREVIDKLNFDSPKKFNYTISSIDIEVSELDSIEQLLKQCFKEEKVKAVYKKPVGHSEKRSKETKNYIANPDNYYSWRIENGLEVFVVKSNNKYYFARTISCFNPKDNVFKDKNRPSIKEKYNTSFRMVSIMIDLLGLDKGKTIIDPFCGTGTFLIEGMIKGYNVVGIDVDEQMVDSSNKNVSWAIKEFKLKKTHKIIRGSSAETKFIADAAVFEPYMGPFLKKAITLDKARNIVKELNDVYFGVFSNLSRLLPYKARVVCILPEFKTFDNKVIPVNRAVYERSGFEVVDVSKIDANMELRNPISYSTPSGSMINRKIYILEKKH
ncbi:MAG: DNA methyltransferase [archaeon]|jgi:tRNA G10  N-methylase Trm11